MAGSLWGDPLVNNGFPLQRYSADIDKKLIKLGEEPNEYTDQIWAKFDQWFVGKCMETCKQIRGQEKARKRQDFNRAQLKVNQARRWP